MKLQMTILLIIIQIMNSYGQNRSEKREYVFIDHSYEKITLKKDSFNYIFSVGLSRADIDGIIKYRNDGVFFRTCLSYDQNLIIQSNSHNYSIIHAIYICSENRKSYRS